MQHVATCSSGQDAAGVLTETEWPIRKEFLSSLVAWERQFGTTCKLLPSAVLARHLCFPTRKEEGKLERERVSLQSFHMLTHFPPHMSCFSPRKRVDSGVLRSPALLSGTHPWRKNGRRIRNGHASKIMGELLRKIAEREETRL